MSSSIILSRTPFRLPLGGGSTDLPSYYKKHGGFIFAVTIDLYMDVLIKQTRADDLINVHYKSFEGVPRVDQIEHPLAREALKMTGIKKGVSISFKADTPAGTGLGSSGACSVALLKGLSLYAGREMSQRKAAEKSFEMTQALGLPDGVQDPYVCAHGGFVLLDIEKDGTVSVRKPRIAAKTVQHFFNNCLFYYTGVARESKHILAEQDARKVLELKHHIKGIGREVYRAFRRGELDAFGELMHEHWNVKKAMSLKMTSDSFDEIYDSARRVGALGGKILGAGGGGYFIFYCPSERKKQAVRRALARLGMREMNFSLDTKGARAKILAL